MVNVYINHEKKFAFVEMRTVEEASNAMALDGIMFEVCQIWNSFSFFFFLFNFFGGGGVIVSLIREIEFQWTQTRKPQYGEKIS